MRVARSGRVDRAHRRGGNVDRRFRQPCAEKETARRAVTDREQRLRGEAWSDECGDSEEIVRPGQQGALAPIEGEKVGASERRPEDGVGDVRDERAWINGEESLAAPRRRPARDVRPQRRIAEIVPGYEHRVRGFERNVFKFAFAEFGFDAWAGDESTLSVRLDKDQAKAAVAFRARRQQRRDIFLRQIGANAIAERPDTVAAGEGAFQPVARRGGEHVEAAPGADRGGRANDVAAALGHTRRLDANVGEDAADAQHPREAMRLHARRSSICGFSCRRSASKSSANSSRGKSGLASCNASTTPRGKLSAPWQAPAIAPAIAAIVSQSPPRLAASRQISQGSSGAIAQIAIAAGTASCVARPVPTRR